MESPARGRTNVAVHKSAQALRSSPGAKDVHAAAGAAELGIVNIGLDGDVGEAGRGRFGEQEWKLHLAVMTAENGLYAFRKDPAEVTAIFV